MSHIPNSAMPHAGHIEPVEELEADEPRPSRRARVREIVRERPKTSAAAGAALIAGLAAAAALPFLSARDRKKPASATPSKGAAAKSPAKKSASKKAAAKPAATKRSAAKPTPQSKRTARAKPAGRAKSGNGKKAQKAS